MKFSDKILNKIKKDKVTPKPRWYFMLMHLFLGAAVFISIVLGSLAVAIVIRHFILTDWELAHQITGGRIKSVVVVLPYLWLSFIGLVMLIADRLFTHTKKGHRVKAWIVATGTVLISVVLGTAFYFVKLDQPVESVLRGHFELYKDWEIKKHEIFSSAEQGVLAGKIVKIDPEIEWMIVDFKGQEWLVDIQDASFKFDRSPELYMMVGITGEQIDENHFEADYIGLWKKPFLLPPPPLNQDFNQAPLTIFKKMEKK